MSLVQRELLSRAQAQASYRAVLTEAVESGCECAACELMRSSAIGERAAFPLNVRTLRLVMILVAVATVDAAASVADLVT